MVSPSPSYDEQTREVQEGIDQMALEGQAAQTSPSVPRYPPNGRALRSHIQLKSKSDDQWLQDMCFLGGLEQFSIIYGFGPDENEAARRHLEWHKYKQQKAWEALRQTKAQDALRKLVSENLSIKDTAEVPAGIPGIPKPTKEELVHEAVLWHENYGHRCYINVLRAASGKVVNGIQISDFTSIGLRDMPCCQACTFAGRNPFDSRHEQFLFRPKFTEKERQKF